MSVPERGKNTVKGKKEAVIWSFKVATYFILIFYLMYFYCQIEISDRFLLLNYAIYFYLLDYLF